LEPEEQPTFDSYYFQCKIWKLAFSVEEL
jgi:hypothetical protein